MKSKRPAAHCALIVPVIVFTWLAPIVAVAQSASPNAAPPAHVVLGVVEEIEVGRELPVNGVVESRSDVLLSSTVEGELKWVAEPGTRLEANEIVARVDDKALRLRRTEQELVTRRATINAEYLSAEEKRLRSLRASNLASETQLASMVSQRDLARNDVAIEQTRLDQIDEELGRCAIRTPVEGVVAQRLKQIGEFARRGDNVARVVDTGDLDVRISVPVAYRNRLQIGSLLSVRISGDAFDGNLHTIVDAGDEQSQTFEALISVPRSLAPAVLDGQFASVTVPLNRQGRSLVVPRDAVVLRRDGNYVVRIDENNLAQRVSVILGEGRGDRVAVDGDLHAGDRVAVRGMERLSDGQAVQPTS